MQNSEPHAYWYNIVERAGPTDMGPEGWEKYLEFSGVGHLTDMVTLDHMLCAPVVPTPVNRDEWEQVADAPDMFPFYWKDLGWLLSRQKLTAEQRVIAVVFNPSTDPRKLAPPDEFYFAGFDLMDQSHSTSAITNCGGFFDVYDPSDIGSNGLIADFLRVCQIKEKLHNMHSEEFHADCNVWAIWSMNEVVFQKRLRACHD